MPAAALVLFGAYLATACPTVFVGDAGELAAAAATLGIPHPSGYPLFCLAGKAVATAVPFGNMAYRLNLASALASVAGAWVAGRLVSEAWGGARAARLAGVCGALAFGLSALAWSQATQVEVYALNTLGLAACLWAFHRWLMCPEAWGRLLAAAALYGWTLTNHQTMFLLAPLLLWAAWRTAPRLARSPLVWAAVALVALIGVMGNAYLAFRAQADAPIAWGAPDTFDRLMDHVRRRQYGRLSKTERSWALSWSQGRFLAEAWWAQYSWWGTALAAAGAWAWVRRARVMGTLLAGMALVGSLGLAWLFNFPVTPAGKMAVAVFFTPVYLIGGLWAGAGAAAILGLPVIRVTRGALGVAAAVAIAAAQIRRHAPGADVSWHTVAQEYGLNLLRSLPRRATIFASGDNAMFSLAYLHLVERWRPDVTVLDDSGYIFEHVYGADFILRPAEHQEAHRLAVQHEVIRRAAAAGREVFYTLENTKHDMAGIALRPKGLLEAVVHGEEAAAPSQEWRRYGWRHARRPWLAEKDYITRNLAAQVEYQFGNFLHARRRPRAAREAYRWSDRVGFDNEWIQSNLGVILMHQGAHEEAVARCRTATEINPGSGEAFLNLGSALDAAAEALREAGRAAEADRVQGEARQAYEQALKLKPTYHMAFFNMGNLYMSQGRLAEAIEQYQKALTHNPGSVEAHINLGNALDNFADTLPDPRRKAELKAGAMEEYRRALALSPQSVEALINLGTAYFNSERRPEALECYERAVAANPRSVEGWFNLANVHYVERRYPQALEGYGRALALDPGYVEAEVNRGQAYERMGDMARAAAAWRAALRIRPGHARAAGHLKRLGLSP